MSENTDILFRWFKMVESGPSISLGQNIKAGVRDGACFERGQY